MGAKKTIPSVENVYTVAGHWVECALRKDDSLFTPGKPIWSPALLQELRSHFLESPDLGEGGFYDKLRQQLGDCSPEAYQLMAEALFVQFLIIWHGQMGQDAKRSQVERVLSWGAPVSGIPDHLAVGLTPGIAASMALALGRPYQVGYILEFVEQWKTQPADALEERLASPWAFKDVVEGLTLTSPLFDGKSNAASSQREAILHLVHPDTFEGIVSSQQKLQISRAEAFSSFLTEEIEDVDRRLERIRQGLEAQRREDFDFHDSNIRAMWDPANRPQTAGKGTPEPKPVKDLETVARRLYLPSGFLNSVSDLLEDKKQVIFQGPPGTGKTYVARVLAQTLAESDERVTLVQLHPSYAYEDFVQGFRPTLNAGQTGFERVNGPLVLAAERARKEPNAKHFLVIDEINRGNVAKVFGELYFLLEYRNENVRLQYHGEEDEPFSLPGNLYIIGTMNTADRSIALVDLALRRRFYFVDFHPDKEPIKGLLLRWLSDNVPEMDWVADVVDRANQKLRDRHAAIGPSYFMKSHLDDDAVESIWQHSILPYVEERLFGENIPLSDFDLYQLL
jgi:MoxR-like ATPase